MNKKALIITSVSLVIVTSIFGVIFYLQTFKTIHFTLRKQPITVSVFKDTNKITSFTTNTDIRLQSGDYIFTTEGDDYDNTPTSFTVASGDTTIDVDPPYSATYQDKVLTTELPAITAALTQAYPIVSSKFTTSRGTIYQDGTWYGTTLTQIPPNPREQGDIYRVVLKKEGGTWVVKTKPALALSERDYPDIPFAVLSDINKKQQ